MLEVSFPSQVNIFHIWAAELTQILHKLLPQYYLGEVSAEASRPSSSGQSPG